MKIILYQPDIAGNLGAVMRSCACFGLSLDIIEPCGFPLTAKSLKRTAMDYGSPESLTRHNSWQAFSDQPRTGRLVLLTTKATTRLPDFKFQAEDQLLFGRESAGVPDDMHAAVDARITIPMAKNKRSLNLAASVSITIYEALRQTGGLPR